MITVERLSAAHHAAMMSKPGMTLHQSTMKPVICQFEPPVVQRRGCKEDLS